MEAAFEAHAFEPVEKLLAYAYLEFLREEVQLVACLPVYQMDVEGKASLVGLQQFQQLFPERGVYQPGVQLQVQRGQTVLGERPEQGDVLYLE